jgi:hypothetical protein
MLVAPVWAQSVATEVSALQVQREDDGLYLTTSVRFELPPAVEDALQKGIPVFFLLEADLVRERWYWYDQKINHSSRTLRLAFQPLTRRWRLGVGSGGSGIGLALSQNFDNLAEALATLQRISHWKVAEGAELDPEAVYSVDFRFRLDLSQLPRPFQIGALGQSDWTISANRRQRLTPELLR